MALEFINKFEKYKLYKCKRSHSAVLWSKSGKTIRDIRCDVNAGDVIICLEEIIRLDAPDNSFTYPYAKVLSPLGVGYLDHLYIYDFEEF